MRGFEKGAIATMSLKILFWLYLINAILLINHEIDSAFWKEWELFKLLGGIGGFLILHFPIRTVLIRPRADSTGQPK